MDRNVRTSSTLVLGTQMSRSNNRLVRHPFKVEIRVRVPCGIRHALLNRSSWWVERTIFKWWRWCNWLAYRTVTAKLTVRFRHDTQHHGFLADMVYASDWKSEERGSSPRESTHKVASFSQLLMNDVLKWNNVVSNSTRMWSYYERSLIGQNTRRNWMVVSVRVGTFSKCFFSSYSGV